MTNHPFNPRVLFVNGINTTVEEAKDHALRVGSMLRLNCRLLYNPADGVIKDLVECLYGRWVMGLANFTDDMGWPVPTRWLAPKTTHYIAQHVRWLLKNNGGEDIIMVGHSQGCMNIMNAMKLLTCKERGRISLHLFAFTNSYVVPGLKRVECFRFKHDYVTSKLAGDWIFRFFRKIKERIFGVKSPGAFIFLADGGHHAFRRYLDKIDNFEAVAISHFYQIARYPVDG